MKPEFECAVAASFLGSARILSHSSNCAALIAAAGTLFAHALAARLVFAVSALAWPPACYLGMRVALDARLFQDLARDPAEGGQALDELLHRWGLARDTPGRSLPERSLSQRSQGALRLWNRLIAAVAVQLTALAAAIVIQAWVS